MKKANVIMTDASEKAIRDWAHALHPTRPKPGLDEAASLALEEFANERRDLLERLADARREIAKRHAR